MDSCDVALVYPPVWYFATVPVELTVVAGGLRQADVAVSTHDLNAAFLFDQWGAHPAWRHLRQKASYQDPAALRQVAVQMYGDVRSRAKSLGLNQSLRRLVFPGVDEANVRAVRAAGLSIGNPARATLLGGVQQVLETAPKVVAVAIVHPDQVPQALALGRMFRRARFGGRLVVYGSLEDVLSPLDFADDLPGNPPHHLFEDFDGVFVGDAEAGLIALARGEKDVPNLLGPHDQSLPEPWQLDLASAAVPDFSGIQAEHYPFPTPVVDLRFGRGCPWRRCAFCAIQSHQRTYRQTSADSVARAMGEARRALGASVFRIRDDLLTPVQLRHLATALQGARCHWSARMRFQRGLTADILGDARQSGLLELWMGLESAVPRLRNLMGKGVADEDVLATLAAARQSGVPLRALCMLGFPGETRAEAMTTAKFVADHQDALCGVSITPFMLLRGSAMAKDPEKWGLRLAPARLPRHARITNIIETEYIPGVARHEIPQMMNEVIHGPLAELLARQIGPWPSQDLWVRSIATV